MHPDDLDQRLSRISTQWTQLFQAHADDGAAAQRLLLQRYSGAVYRYLLGAVYDPDAAGELSQEFALRFLRGDFRRANPERGRFRNYLKTALVNLVNDHHNSRKHRPAPLASNVAGPAPVAAASDDFAASWREDLLERTWKALAKANSDYHAVLAFRIEHTDMPSAAMAEALSTRLGRPVNAAWVRKVAQRAHEKFADVLLDEVETSLEGAGPGELRAELEELDLLRYCRSALERRLAKKDSRAERLP